MAPSKLSDADKQAIIEIYKQPGETTSTIGDRFGVSNSTISRVLKSSLPAEEYSALIQQKRSSSEPAPTAPVEQSPQPDPPVDSTPPDQTPEPAVAASPTASTAETATATDPPTKKIPAKPKLKSKAPAPPAAETASDREAQAAVSPQEIPEVEPEAEPIETVEISPTEISVPRRRRRSRSQEEEAEAGTQLPLLKTESSPSLSPTSAVPEVKLKEKTAPVLKEDDEDLDDSDLSVTDDDYDDDLDDDDEESDDEDWDDDDESLKPHLQGNAAIEIIPLAQANLPKTCYLVVDRTADLITRPLREFGELGQIPDSEIEARTLPIFDNHRVARRFSRRNQRVVKIPDGEVLQKTSQYLHAKGITRLLIDGQVYSLAGEEN
ncbi:hypothetical protein [Almyronema epifaneia]|uniref:Transposase n=1 Tax=Almyronema epifaneia S1 TaxID=2991925 RepID=A0ABW6IJ86_9CYAN